MKKLQYRVIVEEGMYEDTYYLEEKHGRFGLWNHIELFENEDEAIHAMLKLSERARKKRREPRNKVIAKETV